MDKLPFFKRLDILGFKTFPEKTEIHLEPGITTIVGPNGCGKTNIVDAIRWITGEQNVRAIRGSHMEDIIFHGSDSRPPLNIAEVSLTLSNETRILPISYNEVTITRRAFRSGETEFSINKNPCRLKDIKELLMDTGIGTASYSIMEQGKVDLILSSKPEERRFLFEEASGIMKYKTKKKEALHKLEATEQNLLRVNDHLAELKKRINSLKYQAAKAHRYETLQSELKTLELASISNRYHKIRDTWNICYEELEAKEETTAREREKVNESEDNLDRLRQDALSIDAQLSQIQSSSRLTDEEAAKIQSSILLKKERIQNFSSQREKLLAETETLKNNLKSSEEKITLLETQGSGLAKEAQDTEERLSSDGKSLEELGAKEQSYKKELGQMKVGTIELAAEQSRRRNELSDNHALLKSASTRVGRLTSEKTNVTNERERFQGEVEKSQTERDEKAKQTAEIVRSLESEEAGRLALNEQTLTLSKDISSCEVRLSSSESRLSLLNELSEHYEGHSEGARSILAEREKLPGICGTVAELLEVPREFEAAIESALGTALQYIIIDRQEDAKALIKMLRSEKKGRAVFLPVDRVSLPAEKSPPDKNAEGIIGVASELVKFNPKYKNIFSYLLADTFIIENIAAASAINIPSAKLLTKEGELICAGGPLGGGSPQEAGTGLLVRKREIAELAAKIPALREQLHRAEEQRKETSRKAQEADAECERLKAQREKSASSLIELNSVHSETLIRSKRLDEEFALTQQELDEAISEEALLRKEENELTANLDEITSENEENRRQMEELEEALRKSGSDREELFSTMTELKITLASLTEKVSAKKLEMQFQLEQKEESLRQIQEKTEEGELAVKNSDAQAESIQDDETRLEKLLESKIDIKKSSEAVESEKERLRDLIYKAENELKEKRNLLTEESDTLHKQSLRETELKTEMGLLEKKALSDYSVSIESLLAEKAMEADEEVIAQLKKRIESMGGVNLLAIAEYKQTEENFNSISSQQEDLTGARASLEKAITKIDRTTTSLFIETFQKIKNNFQETFQELFGGGRAQLLLLDEENALESGIEIIAKPPGKKTQSISLLSGGERALTAIALLFAIYRLKPSPFCVLDEIDAPLDDSNIGRFAKMVKEFTKQSQFIIITHNRVTIAISDIMYGITMQEHGVSKIISVKLTQPA